MKKAIHTLLLAIMITLSFIPQSKAQRPLPLSKSLSVDVSTDWERDRNSEPTVILQLIWGDKFGINLGHRRLAQQTVSLISKQQLTGQSSFMEIPVYLFGGPQNLLRPESSRRRFYQKMESKVSGNRCPFFSNFGFTTDLLKGLYIAPGYESSKYQLRVENIDDSQPLELVSDVRSSGFRFSLGYRIRISYLTLGIGYRWLFEKARVNGDIPAIESNILEKQELWGFRSSGTPQLEVGINLLNL